MRLIPDPPGRITAGELHFKDRDFLALSDRAMRDLRGKEIAMIFQDPMTSLNPMLRMERQMTEGIVLHLGLGKRAARDRAIEMLQRVGIPAAERRIRDYPHQFSGGMRQRVVIAIALSCNPSLILADEPTTALDVTIQAQILELMREVTRESNTAVMLITHDLGVVAGMCERILVMYAGSIVEEAPRREIFYNPRHPYTIGLLKSVPRLDREREERLPQIEGLPPDLSRVPSGLPLPHALPLCHRPVPADHAAAARGRPGHHGGLPLRHHARERGGCLNGWQPGVSSSTRAAEPRSISVKDLRTYFPIGRHGLFGERYPGQGGRRPHLRYLQGRDAGAGRRIGLREEHDRPHDPATHPRHVGRGAATTGATSASSPAGEMRRMRRRLQIIFQDPYASLNSRMRVETIIGDALAIHRLASGRARRERVGELLRIVGLDPAYASRYPHEFSGGQRQRIGIARALAVKPEFIVCDEPISALDVSIRAQIINLLEDLQEEFGLTYLFIAHDLAVVRHICDRVAVMYLGKFMELSGNKALYDEPLHPYTQSLISAVPVPDPDVEDTRKRIILTGDVPTPVNPPSGCVFHTRCPIARERCAAEAPAWRELRPKHWVACHYAGEPIAQGLIGTVPAAVITRLT